MIIKFDNYIKENLNVSFINDISNRINSLLLTYTNEYIKLYTHTQYFYLYQNYCEHDSFTIIKADIITNNKNNVLIDIFDNIPEQYNFSIKKRYNALEYNYNIENIINDIKKDIDTYIKNYYINMINALKIDYVEYIIQFIAIFNEEDYLNFIEYIILNADKLNFQSTKKDILHSIINTIYEEESYSMIKDKLYNKIKHYIDAKNFDLI